MTDTQAIKDRLDIVQIIGEYVRLKKAGINWKANCPFHNEKSPSFMVQPEKQFWHCFGCSKGGDVFSFLQEMEGVDFSEALKILADRAGVKLDSYASEVNKSQKNRIIEINNKATYFFNHFLSEMPAAEAARDYLKRRELTTETITEWQVGFIPEQWDLLTKYLLNKGNSIDDLLASGLAIKKDGGGFYDRFRGRIMFPIWDAHGNVVGFTGRILVETEKSGGKYVNTPQTLVFDKSRLLYGLNKAKTEIKAKDFTVLVEGQMDVIACHQAGMKNVVASSGTALTMEQIKLLKRYSNNIAIAFDADAAGQNAAKRGIDLALEQGMSIKIIQIPPGAGKDADECIKKDKDVWFKAVESAKEVMDWYFTNAVVGVNKNDPKQKQKIAEVLLAEIARLPYAVERDHWLKKLADEIGVDRSVLVAEMSRVVAQAKRYPDNSHANLASKPASPSIAAASQENWEEKGKIHLLAENFFALLLKFPQLFAQHAPGLRSEFFEHTPLAGLYESLKKHYNGNIDIMVVKNSLTKEEQSAIDILVLKTDKDYSGFDAQQTSKELSILLGAIKSEWQKNKRQKLFVELKEAEKNGDPEAVQKILKEIMELEK
ncbi:MAG: DNA primase [Candidatus Magasanikbacteria bacterium RIFOXYD2_FULL_39_9]|uniref:DNA primase n=1 Tax=Candidatus Magasanikbacteria bacterium RIFOXYD1_FULL_40_23 TaxID=1798705 RepID=A0A1F6P9Q7_9BACT|nr:MAG: DNA primase [Candidatus Magasanikbacteria bacterium RIFOXYD2_FULL_39_9]OGH92902.1 MAG: DNA primase [Candidatus Magasanikbacteria bacterium RIFOXYD1_FULL_40_23]